MNRFTPVIDGVVNVLMNYADYDAGFWRKY